MDRHLDGHQQVTLRARLEDVPEPKCELNDVLIRVNRTGICGTDLHIYKWDDWARKTIPVPMVVGHEFVGEVVKSDTAALTEAARQTLARQITGAFLDENRTLHAITLDAAIEQEILESLVPTLKAAGARVICYGSHVDAPRLKAARQAGCDEVLPRSAFFDELGAKLQLWSRVSAN